MHKKVTTIFTLAIVLLSASLANAAYVADDMQSMLFVRLYGERTEQQPDPTQIQLKYARFLYGFFAASDESLGEQYELAQKYGLDCGLAEEEVLEWAGNFVQHWGFLCKGTSLEEQARRARLFCMDEEGLGLDEASANEWVQKYMKRRAGIHSDLLLDNQCEQALRAARKLGLTGDTVKTWAAEVVRLNGHIYRDCSMIEQFKKTMVVVESHFGFSAYEAYVWTATFMLRRGCPLENKTLVELYTEARAFALSSDGLGLEPEGAKRWAQDYVSRNGYVHGAKSLGEQYAAAKAFAQSPEGLHVTSGLARAWALDFLNKCGVIDGNQSVDEQHQEATEFAKSSLMMISSYAKRWAARFVLEHVKRSQ